MLGVGIMERGFLNFPTSFDVDGFTFVWDAEASQTASIFLTKGIEFMYYC